MHISVHTVEAHLSRIYRKLGIRSRAALARRLPGEESSRGVEHLWSRADANAGK